MKKINRICISALLLLAVLFTLPSAKKPCCGQQSYAAGFPSCSAAGMAVMEITSKKVFHSKDMHRKMPMASTTKILTALVVIENTPDLDKKVVVPRKAAGVEGSSIYLKAGEEISVRSLLYGLMLSSGNDAAEALAITTAGSTEAFAALMNEKAAEIDAVNSSFKNPHGLDHKEHYTTAYDLALITSCAMQNSAFKEICSTKNYTIPETNMTRSRYIFNKNKLLRSLPGAVGVKTGFTKRAGRCLVSAAERDDMTVVAVVLNCGPMFEECAAQLEGAFNIYKFHEILKPFTICGEILVKHGEKEYVSVYNERPFTTLIKKGEEKLYSVEYDYKTEIEAPFEAGTQVGSVNVYKEGELVFSDAIKLTESVKGTRTRDILGEIIEEF